MKTSNKITVTQGRLENAIDRNLSKVVTPQIKENVQTAVRSERIRTGVVTKFYPYLDKAEVELDNSDRKVLCKILHRFGGNLTEYFTPTADSKIYCEDLHEPAYTPRGTLHCLVIRIHDEDSLEWLLLGFYQNEELIGVNPASPGNFKIVLVDGTNQYWIKFGQDGLDIRLPRKSSTKVGDYDEDMMDLDFVTSDDVYLKEDVYTKEEVDELIKKAVEEALNDME